MIEAERVAKEQGFATMGLTVNASNERAIRFYEKRGWHSLGMLKDSVRMEKRLTP
jgi:ribosomal protein S18 acetylase RimI-like enzyme